MGTRNNEYDDKSNIDEELTGETSQICPICSNNSYYSYRYDALFCSKCNQWLEEKCEDPYCEFCSDRPDKPVNKNLGGIDK